MKPLEAMKKAAGVAAASFVQNGMLVGLGTGSTVFYFIEKLIERHHSEKLNIQAVASSKKSLIQAEKGGIPLIDINKISFCDLTVDGADEIDTAKQMIKGGGGAMVREKILATMSREMAVIVDETKLVSKLGKAKLPVEILPFAHTATRHQLEKLGYQGNWRKNASDSFYVTENGNYILDIHFKELRENPSKDHEAMLHLPGVVDTGFFFHLAGRVVVGFSDGQVVIK